MKKLSIFLGGVGFYFVSSLHAAAILSIVPSQTTMTVRNDGQVPITYTVTNNTNQPINNLLITPNYQTKGQPSAVTLAEPNTCTSLLAGNGHCQFDVLIKGAGQPLNFQVRPQVCGYSNAAFCSVADSTNILRVSVVKTSTSYAYFALNTGLNANTMIPLNAATLNTGTPFSVGPVNTNILNSPVTVSPDGKMVLIAYCQTSYPQLCTLDVLSPGNNPTLIQGIPMGYIPNFGVLVMSPDQQTIYAAGSADTDLHRIDKIAGVYTYNATVPVGVPVNGIAFSPDSQIVYITDYYSAKFYVMDNSNNQVIQTLTNNGTTCEFDAPSALVVASNGNTIYVANSYGVEGIPVVQKNADGTYSCGARITPPSIVSS